MHSTTQFLQTFIISLFFFSCPTISLRSAGNSNISYRVKYFLSRGRFLIMSLIEMASAAGKFRYQKLRPSETGLDDDEIRERVVVSAKNNKWYRFRRIPKRRRFRVKVPSLRRLWRRKAMMASAMRRSCAKVMKRLKEGQAHFGDLFAGNYLFMQINPTSLAYLERELTLSKIA